jgi:hypothetical protein
MIDCSHASYHQSVGKFFSLKQVASDIEKKLYVVNTYISERVNKLLKKIKNEINNLYKTEDVRIKEVLAKKKPKNDLSAQDTRVNKYFHEKSSLEFNLKLAQELLEETIKEVPFSANNFDRSREVIEKRAKKRGIGRNNLSLIVREANSQGYANRKQAETENANRNGTSFNEAKIASKNASSASVGNCWEMAIVALFKGMEKGVWNIRLDRVSIVNGDHTFLVIGRDSQSDPKNYKTWGPNAVVMDAWANKVYALEDLEKNLYDYIGTNWNTGKPHLVKFNSEKSQYLEVSDSNMSSVEDLLEFKKTAQMCAGQEKPYQEVMDLLKNFHQADTLPMKLQLAKSLKDLTGQLIIKDLNSIRFLHDQIDHFIELNRN